VGWHPRRSSTFVSLRLHGQAPLKGNPAMGSSPLKGQPPARGGCWSQLTGRTGVVPDPGGDRGEGVAAPGQALVVSRALPRLAAWRHPSSGDSPAGVRNPMGGPSRKASRTAWSAVASQTYQPLSPGRCECSSPCAAAGASHLPDLGFGLSSPCGEG